MRVGSIQVIDATYVYLWSGDWDVILCLLVSFLSTVWLSAYLKVQQHTFAMFGLLSFLSPDVIISTCPQIFHNDVHMWETQEGKCCVDKLHFDSTRHPVSRSAGDSVFHCCFFQMPTESKTKAPTPWGVRRCNLLVPRARRLRFSFLVLGKEDSAVSKLESWLRLSDVLLPVGHVKGKGDKFNANHSLSEAGSSLAVWPCSSLWRNCFSLEFFQTLLWRDLMLQAQSHPAGPRTTRKPALLIQADFSRVWHWKHGHVSSVGS